MAQNPDTHKPVPYKTYPLGPDSVSTPVVPASGPVTAQKRQHAGGEGKAPTKRKAQTRQSA